MEPGRRVVRRCAEPLQLAEDHHAIPRGDQRDACLASFPPIALEDDPPDAAGLRKDADGADADGEPGVAAVPLRGPVELLLRRAADLVELLEVVIVTVRHEGEGSSGEHSHPAADDEAVPGREREVLLRLAHRQLGLDGGDFLDELAAGEDGAARGPGREPCGEQLELWHLNLDAPSVERLEAQRSTLGLCEDIRRGTDEPSIREGARGAGADGERVRRDAVPHDVVRGRPEGQGVCLERHGHVS